VSLLANQAQVYLYATNKLLLRNIDNQRTFTTTADKLFFLCELAWHMIESGELRIHYKDIPDRIQQHFGEKIKDAHELDHWDFDLRNQTLLRPDLSGYYEFSHKSLAEYFVAFKFAAELGCLSEPFLETYREEDAQQCELPYEKKTITELAKTVGVQPIAQGNLRPVREFMSLMVAEDGWDPMVETLLDLHDHNDYGYLASTIATMLSDTAKFPRDCDLCNLDLKGVQLKWSSISELRLNGVLSDDVQISHMVATARQQNRNVLELLTACCSARLDDSAAPSLLPATAEVAAA